MKKILLLLLLATFSIQAQTLQNPTYGNVKLKNNATDNSATKVNVQSTDGTINTISKSDLVNVVEVNDVPSLPLTGVADKIYVVKNVNKIYRWNGTFYQELAVTDISGKINLSEKGAINGVATLGSDGKVPNSQIPALAISETFPVSSQAQMLALSQADQGDVAIRSDISKSFILRVLPSSVLANWNELLTPTSAVTSVNGQVGVVTLSKSDVGLSNVDNTSDANKPVSNATQTALNLKENTFSKNTAFNKNFGTTAGTVVEGGTLGSNAYSSTAYLPLSGGTVNGPVLFNSTTGGLISFQTNSLPSALMTSSQNIIGEAGSATDFNTYVYGNNPYNIWTNGVKRLEISGLGEFKINNLSGTGTRNVVADASGNLLTDSTVYAPLNGTGATGTWGIDISGNSQTSSALGSYNWNPTVKDNADYMFGRNSANEIAIISQLGARNFLGLGSNAYTSTAYLPLSGGTLTGTVTAPTAPAGTNTTQIATTAFVAGGLAIKENAFSKNTAFNKNFGTTVGTVAEGNDSRINNGQTAFGWGNHAGLYPSLTGAGANGTWGINISGSASSATNWGGIPANFVNWEDTPQYLLGTSAGVAHYYNQQYVRNFLGLGSNAYSSTAYLPLSGGTLTGIVTAPTAPAGTNTTQIATTAFVQANSRPYKVYTALISQSGTNAPVATVLENNLGGTVVWSREATGFYKATLAGVFTLNKTTVLITQGTGQAIYSAYGDTSTNHVKLIGYSFSGTQIDDILNKTTIEIRVYN